MLWTGSTRAGFHLLRDTQRPLRDIAALRHPHMNRDSDTMAIRSAVPVDAHGIAHVQVATWRTAYRGILPDDVLAGLSVERREQSWRERAEHLGEGRSLWVAEDDDRIVGFACGGPEQSGDPDFAGELYAIYVLEEYQGRGIGRRLTRSVGEALLAAGIHTMLVWVLAANGIGRRFYEALGGRAVHEQQQEIGGTAYPEVAYGWADLGALVARLRADG